MEEGEEFEKMEKDRRIKKQENGTDKKKGSGENKGVLGKHPGEFI
jgi:hypothetical protein